MKYIFNKQSKNVVAKLSDNIDVPSFLYHASKETKANLDYVFHDIDISDYKNYMVIGKELIKRSEQEIKELRRYGKILTEEERVNVLLSPSSKEIAKAENTIEILSTLQEVGLINMNIVDDKLIECYTILTLAKGIADKTIQEAMQFAGVPEKYKQEVEVRVARKRIDKLPESH